MFEADNQLQLDEYTAGAIRQRNFEDDTRLWKITLLIINH